MTSTGLNYDPKAASRAGGTFDIVVVRSANQRYRVIAMVKRLNELKVPAEVELYKGKPHAWFNKDPDWRYCMARVSELDARLVALIEELREPSESIWCWQQAHDGQISVMLIEAGNLAHARRMVEVGLAGGEGRSLQFKQVEGQWELQGQGCWVG